MALPAHTVYLAVGVLAALENVFPPVPADTAVALGAFLSSAGRVSALGVFLVTWVANVSTATAVYAVGRTVGRSFFRGRFGRRLLHPRHLLRLERLYQEHGWWGIFFSRFIPAVRAVVPPFAGIARLGLWRSVVPMALASGIWYGSLTYLVAKLATRLDEVSRLVARLNRAAFLGALIGLALLAGGSWFRRRRRAPAARAAAATPRAAPASGPGNSPGGRQP